MVSDLALLKELPAKVKDNVLAYVGCIAGADPKDAYLSKIRQAGFGNVEVVEEQHLPAAMLNEVDIKTFITEQKLTEQEIAEISDAIVSIKVSAIKP